MASADGADSSERPPTGRRRGRVRTLFASSRTLVRLVYRDPEHLPERLALSAVERLGEPSRAWAGSALASNPGKGPAVLATELRRRTASGARVDGAIAGTPFFVALVPAYVGYLWQEAQMTLRTAALYGRDPVGLPAAAELLALRGVHPTVAAAQEALEAVVATPLPEKPAQRRRVRTWIASVRMLLVFGGFLEGSTGRSRSRPVSVVFALAGIGVWVITWVFPLSFMLAMAWSCETDARRLGRRAQAYYGGDAPTAREAIRIARLRHRGGHSMRTVVRSFAAFCSITVPIAFVAYADHVRNTTGVSGIVALGALVSLSLVVAIAILSRSR